MMNKLCVFFLLISFLCSGQKYTKAEIFRITDKSADSAMVIYQTADSLKKKVLLAKSADVKTRNKFTKILVERMKYSLLTTKGGVGIAAPQVGINRNIIWVKRFDKKDVPLEYFLNPKITWRSEILNLGAEGDLSIEKFRDQFFRSRVIQVEYFDLKGKKHIELVEGFTAVIFQHEIDHLSGILITDKIKDQDKQIFEKTDSYLKRAALQIR